MHSQNVVDFVNDPFEVEVALETGEAAGNDVLGGGRLLSLELNQVRSLTQFYSVDFSQSDIK